MRAETNGYTQLCDKCHRLMCGEEVRWFNSPQNRVEGLALGWYVKDGNWMNQVCAECHLALRLEGKL